ACARGGRQHTPNGARSTAACSAAQPRPSALEASQDRLTVMSPHDPPSGHAAPLPPPADPKLRRMANALRALAMDAVEQAKSGHPGMPMGMADIAAVLWTQFLRFDPQMPDWPDRDRFILSNGHGSMLLYGLLHLTGYPDMTMDEIRHFRQVASPPPRPPEPATPTAIHVPPRP